ncbi:MAG: hypothetical protein WAM82_03850 [Thermoanaerobaculia bacterium]
MKSESDDALFQAAFEEAALLAGVPSDFFLRLYHVDDWSFVVQCHAIVEGVLSEILVTDFGDPRLRLVLERLSFGDSRSGKLAFAAARELLTNEELSFARIVSQLRNRLIHRFREHIPFSLASYVEALDVKDQDQLFRTLLETFRSDPKRPILSAFSASSRSLLGPGSPQPLAPYDSSSGPKR